MAYLSTLQIETRTIAEGDRGIYETCYQMRKEINIAKSFPAIVNLARSIIGNVQDQALATRLIAHWVSEHIHYREDNELTLTERGIQRIAMHDCLIRFKKCEPVEILYKPFQVLQQGYGDCDDFVMLISSLLEAVGIKACSVIVALDPSQPREFTHVYLVANVNSSWIPIDGINKTQPWGWEVPMAFRREVIC